VEEPKSKRGPNWRIEHPENARKGVKGAATGGRGRGGNRGEGVAPAASNSATLATEEKALDGEEEEVQAPAPMIEAGLFACYDSSDDDSNKPPTDRPTKPAAHAAHPQDPLLAGGAGSLLPADTAPRPVAPGADARGDEAAGSGSAAGAVKQGGRPRKPCIYFARGRCNKGARCTFAHVAAAGAAAGAAQGPGGGGGGGKAASGRGGGTSNKGYLPHSSLKRSGLSLVSSVYRRARCSCACLHVRTCGYLCVLTSERA